MAYFRPLIPTTARWRVLLPLLCVVLAALLRCVAFPHLSSPAIDLDEPGYLADGLLMIEGVPLGHGFAPSGPITWFVALYAGMDTIVTWLSHDANTLQFPRLLRPVAALEVTLFRIYADMSVLRLTVAFSVSLLSLWAVWGISRFGDKQAGSAGALAGGLLAAALPIVLEMSIQARPYGIAWSFALLAAAAAATGRERSRALRAGICLGIAVASRIDMVMVGPLVLLVLCLDSKDGNEIARAMVTFAVASLISFLLIAPWYLPHLIDNLRNILSVRILPN